MCADAHLASRHRAAKQNIPFHLIFREVCVRVVMFHRSFEQSSRAGETASVMTDRGQANSIGGGRVPDVLLIAAIKAVEAYGSV
jgi:hypothetical protein